MWCICMSWVRFLVINRWRADSPAFVSIVAGVASHRDFEGSEFGAKGVRHVGDCFVQFSSSLLLSMPYEESVMLTQEQVDFYQENGYLLVRGVFTRDQAAV